jgi:AcrR family transcriptional regulator
MTSLPDITTIAPEAASKGEHTRALILQAAYELFTDLGYHGASMRKIAHKAGIALSGIYNHFDNKEAIFAAVLDAYHPYRRLLPALEAAQGHTVEEIVRDAAWRVHTILQDIDVRLLPLVFIELVEFQGRHVAQMVPEVFPNLASFAQRATQASGRVRPVPPIIVLRTFMGLVISFVFTGAFLRMVDIPEAIRPDAFDRMIDIFLFGILDSEAKT